MEQSEPVSKPALPFDLRVIILSYLLLLCNSSHVSKVETVVAQAAFPFTIPQAFTKTSFRLTVIVNLSIGYMITINFMICSTFLVIVITHLSMSITIFNLPIFCDRDQALYIKMAQQRCAPSFLVNILFAKAVML